MRRVTAVLGVVIALTTLTVVSVAAQPMRMPMQGSQLEMGGPLDEEEGYQEGMGPAQAMMQRMCGMMGRGGMMPMMRGRQMMGRPGGPSGMGMTGMMGMPMGNQADPKVMGRMFQLRGEMMKAMGEVLLKHGKAMEEGK